MTPEQYQAKGDENYAVACKLREEANQLLIRAQRFEFNAIVAWAKAEILSTPPLDKPSASC